MAESLRDVNARILQAVTAEQREIFESSALDGYLLDAERDDRRRAHALAARDEPSLEPFLPRRGDGVVLSASDIDTYRTCPLKYKFARVFRIPQEPTLHQRFGILVHQVLERYHGMDVAAHAHLPELLGLLEAGWRRGGFGDSEEERQLRGKATAALTRYHDRFRSEEGAARCGSSASSVQARPASAARAGRPRRPVARRRVRADRLQDRQAQDGCAARATTCSSRSTPSARARHGSWRHPAQAYYYLLDDQKVSVPDDGDRGEWIRDVAYEVADGIMAQGFEPTPSFGACAICDYRLVCPAAER